MRPSDSDSPDAPDAAPQTQAGGSSSPFERASRALRTVPARWAWIAVATITVLVIAVGLLTPSAGTSPPGSPTATVSLTPAPDPGHIAPNVTLLDLSNRQVPISSLRGDIVVLNFWYVACPPCQTEMPLLEQVYHADQGRHVVIVGVNVADDAQTISTFVSRLGIDYPVLRDVGQRAVLAYRITNTPTSIVLDRHGVIRGREVGAFPDAASIDRLITPWLSQT